jgi:hypothetical protein
MTNESPKLLLFHKKCCNRNTLVGMIEPGRSAQDCTSEKPFKIFDRRINPSLPDPFFNFFTDLLVRKISWIILEAGSTQGGSAPMKENVRVVFRVQEVSGREPWIRLEPIDKDLRVLGSGFLGFELPEGTTINTAEEIAAFLQENISSVSYTLP